MRDKCASCNWCRHLIGEECWIDGREIYRGDEAKTCEYFSVKEEFEKYYDECFERKEEILKKLKNFLNI